MAHQHNEIDFNQRFVFAAKAQSSLIYGIVAGIVAVALGCLLLANGIGVAEKHGDTKAAEKHTLAVAEQKAVEKAAHHDATKPDEHKGEAVVHNAGAEHAAAAGHEVGHTAADEGHVDGEHLKDGAASSHHEFHWYQRLWANIWLNGVFFTGLSIVGLFFVAVNYVAEAGWSAGIKRVPEAFASFLPFSVGALLLTFIFGGHSIFHWLSDELYQEGNPAYDEILVGKQPYLNAPFFIARMVIFVGLWMFFNRLIRKNSVKEDVEGGTKWHFKNVGLSATFLVIFAVSSSMLSWDWVMSIDTHWYSTLFGWYFFASWWVSGLSTIAITTILLKEKGLLPNVSENHIHDLGKFIFAFSIFWTYLWVAQYLLIYYANIPEEAIYFINRVHGLDHTYTGVFFVNLIINFIFPFLVLMTRDAKRTNVFLKVVGFGLLAGHWLDFYQMVMPGTVGVNGGFGFVEFGMLAIFACGYVLVVSRSIASAPLIAKNHPMLEESLHHEV